MKKILFVLLLLMANFASAQVLLNPGGGAAAGTSAGTVISGCTAYSIVYIDSTGALQCDQAPQNGNTSTAGTATTKINAAISGAGATSNFLNITGAFNATLSATTTAFLITTAVDNDNQIQYGISSTLTGAGTASAGWAKAAVFANGTNTGNLTVGLWGEGNSTATNTLGSYSAAPNGASANRIAGYFTLGGEVPSAPGSAGLLVNNGSVAANIADFRDNNVAPSTTGAAANVAILDGAQMRLGPMGLTSATMTPTIVSEARTVTSSYAWTNAMVVALGAVTAGDITVATLPAKTRVDNAIVVIDTAAGTVATLTVSCGDAIVGTPFINYVVASDAKAAANTVYGDLISGAETGTSLFDATTKWRENYIPSYTATTLITCHFISTGGNLSTVTTSTGRLILTTTLLP